ncbi:MAG: S8 family serine peptidase [Chthoniobacterales bacterium]|nr:S8 family serine peptidase [Chthoniobacterales bacterium]
MEIHNHSKIGPLRRIIGFLFLAAAVAAVLGAVASSRAVSRPSSPEQAAALRKIAPWVTEHTADGKQAEFMVVLADQADLSGAAALSAKNEKGHFVRDALWNKSQATQGPVLQFLQERGLEHRSFYIVNAILVKGSREIAETLAARPDVARVEGNPQIKNALPQPEATVEGPIAPLAVEPGIVYTNAPSVWAQGFTGQNIVIASADTGVRWTHNALKPHYRGWNGVTADHNYNWHDSIHSGGGVCGPNAPAPCDDFFHGSHTLGTAIGDDGAGNQIGMAPGAKWIACRNMNVGVGTPSTYIECMQFFLAPTPVGGGAGDPTKGPDVTINSWGCPTSEGCSVTTLQSAVEAQAAAGIMMVVAAGNAGSSCSTVTDPPSFYAASYTVGALNTSTDTVASFSSRGPVLADGSNRTKPDISAPGTNTRSASNSSDSAYTFASGTSMATPHIAGAVGLLWSAHPEMQNQIDASRTLLNSTTQVILSTQCGVAGPPNNVYGWGRVNILAAVDAGGGGDEITLSATVQARGTKARVTLTWEPADGGNINVLRDGAVVQTTADDGNTKDNHRNASGSTFTYKVCETDSGDCSNEVQVTIP